MHIRYFPSKQTYLSQPACMLTPILYSLFLGAFVHLQNIMYVDPTR